MNNKLWIKFHQYLYKMTLKNKIMIPTILVVFASFLIFTLFITGSMRGKDTKDLKDKTERFTNLIIASNMNNLWQYEVGAMESICKSFFSDPDITRINIKEGSGIELVNLTKKIKGSNDISVKREFVMDDIKIGTLEVTFTDYHREAALTSVRNNMFIMACVVFVLIALTITWISKIVFEPIPFLVSKVNKITQGDLTIDGDNSMDMSISSAISDTINYASIKDEIVRLVYSFNEFTVRIIDVIRDVKFVSAKLIHSIEEMHVASVSFSDNAQNQAASSEEINSGIENMAVRVKNVVEGAEDQLVNLNMLIERIQDLSRYNSEMNEMIGDVQQETRNISDNVKEAESSLDLMSQSMTRIGESSKVMTGIVNIISDISEQINLLSLNAAIEAARAGDAGRGFAVVSDEITKLADETAASIKDIVKIIKENDNEIQKGMKSVQSTVANTGIIISGVNKISDKIDLTFGAMQKQIETGNFVNKQAEIVKTKSVEIKTATDEQKLSIDEIVTSVNSISTMTQENASNADQLSNSAGEINTIAEGLKSKVDFFVVK